MLSIKFGTDGWRAIIAQDFTVDNVARVSEAVSIWLKKNYEHPSIVIGHDCRFGGELFVDTAIKVFCANGIKVTSHHGFVSTPMISYAALQHSASQGIVITASHNPPSYNGYKLKGAHGGPTPPHQVAEVEALIPDALVVPSGTLQHYQQQDLLHYADFEQSYIDYLHTKFDIAALQKSRMHLAYDAMWGAGQNVMRRLFPNAVLLHCERNPLFNNIAPEPLHKNLLELSDTIAQTPELKFGIANDGDADRIALYDDKGVYVDSHHIILLLIHYLVHYKKMSGKVAIATSTTLRVNKLCAHYGLDCIVTPIGFKYISEIMMHEDVLVGGEESGGISIKGHIPERDGIFDGLTIYEFMNSTGKSLNEIIAEVYDIVGAFYYHRDDLTLTQEAKEKAVNICKAGLTQIGNHIVESTDQLDGFKFILNNDCWCMVRASGTEPVLRVYAEGNTKQECMAIIEAMKKAIL
jgi:phosphomannomutase